MNQKTIIFATFCALGFVFGLNRNVASNIDRSESHIRAVLGEAENQGFQGMLAVACGINNRPEGLQGVYGAQSNRYEKTTDQYRSLAKKAVSLARNPANCGFLQGADMWCSDMKICSKSWQSIPMYHITKIKDHDFFKRITTRKR